MSLSGVIHCAVIILVTLSGYIGADPPEPCVDVPLLEFSLESEDVSETCGQILVAESISSVPKYLRFDQAKPGKRYIVLLVDPLVPADNVDNTTSKYFLHWLLTDVEGSMFKTGRFNSSDESTKTNKGYAEKMPYYPPNPPQGSGLHHYQLFVYEQTSDDVKGIPQVARAGFSVDTFVGKNKLGDPQAAFEFLS